MRLSNTNNSIWYSSFAGRQLNGFKYSCYNYTHIHAEYILTQWIKTGEDLKKKYTSHFICKSCVWEGVGDRTELQHIDPHSYGHQRCVFFVLQGCSTGSPGAHSAGCGLSLPQLVTDGSPNSIGVPRAPSAGWWLSLPHLVTNGSGLETNWHFVFTELYNSSIAHSISLEWHVWSSSSGNNCHAVHRSLSSGESVYDCTMGFYLVPFCQPSPPTRFLPITAIGMCHFLPVYHFGMACLAGSKVNIRHIVLATTMVEII